jgi:CzcA family heavy metal efflux pump
MLDSVIGFSLRNRGLVLLLAGLAFGYGMLQLREVPLDVFPDLNRPTVTVMTEAPGLAPEEVEVLVTRPMEYLLNGTTGVKRVRSASGIGLSIIWVEFDWETDIFRDRQIVSEKLQLASERLPAGVTPVLAPISSIMGEIMLLGLRAEELPAEPAAQLEQSLELRTLAEFTVRNRILAVEGISQVTVMGGVLKQYQIMTSPERLAAQQVTLEQLVAAAEKANVISGGGIMERGEREALIRINGQSLTLEEIGGTVVAWRDPRPVLVRDVAEVRLGGPVRRGDGGVWVKEDGVPKGGAAVILAIQKQPGADTLRLDASLDSVLNEIQAELPRGVRLERRVFRQAEFIQAAVDNVAEAIRDGALWVVVILFLFMWNFRTSISSLISMPLSILLTVIVFRWLGVSVNTMTMGGVAVAIGDLVDDSIVDIENIFRRLKENRQLAAPRPVLQVVFDASREVRNSIVYATLIVTLVVLPLFALEGLEGRMFAPLGLAYIVSLLCSLLVSLTVTPVLGYLLLGRARLLERRGDAWLLAVLKSLVRPILRLTLRWSGLVLFVVAILCALSILSIGWMGGEFLPPFNEGTLTVNLQAEPGTSLEESQRIAKQAEQLLLEVPEVVAVSRRTGRAELDEHAEGVNSSEIEVRLLPERQPLPGVLPAFLRAVPLAHFWGYEQTGRARALVWDEIRDRVTRIPGVKVNIGQPISHRLDHVMSGVRAQIAVKIFGSDLTELRARAQDVATVMAEVRGVVDLLIEPQIEIPQLRLRVKPVEAARYGLAAGDIARLLETAYRGRVVSQILEEDRYFDLVVWFEESARSDPGIINQTILETPSGRRVALGTVAEVLDTTGPNTINRENVQRRMVVSCNVAGRDLAGVVGEIRERVQPIATELVQLPGSYRLELGGQFEAQQAANVRLAVLGLLAVIVIFLLLTRALRSSIAALQVLANIPLAALGSVIALLIVNQPDWEILNAAPVWDWPRLWFGSITLSVAHWVGFITLIGIVSRNGIMMLSHYLHLMEHEGEVFGEEMIIRGSLERLAPVMMTALTSFVGLLPLLLGAGEPGKEILHPLAVVVFGGMLASTILDQVVTPALFYRVGRRINWNSMVSGKCQPENVV